MKAGIYALALALILAASLAAVAAAPASTAATVSDHYTLTARIDDGLASGEVYWLNLTFLAQEDARVKVIALGPYSTAPATSPVFTLYIDDKMVFNATAAGPLFGGLLPVTVPAANGTLKGGTQRSVKVRVKNGDAISAPALLQILIERNFTAQVSYDNSTAKVTVKATAVQGGFSASKATHLSGAEDLFLIGNLVDYIADKSTVSAAQVKDAGGNPTVFVDVHNEGGFPGSGFTVTVTVKPVALTVSWKYDGLAGGDPAGYARVLEGTKVEVSAAAPGALTVFDNGTAVGAAWAPKAGKHALGVVYVGSLRVVPPYWVADAAVPSYNATYTSMTVETLKVVASHTEPTGYKPPFQLELAPGAAKDGVRYFNLLIKVPEGALVVEKAEAVRFDGAVQAGIASTVETAENLTTYQYLVNYTYALHRVEGAGLLKAVWGIEGAPTVSSSTPTVHYVSTGKPFVVEADRPLIRVLDSAGGDVAFVGGAVAVSKSDTYTVKLVTYLKVVNTYEGKPVDALVTVRDAKTGLILFQKRGGEVTFELEPQVSYLVESSTGAETLTAKTTLPQDTTMAFTFTKPPAVSINWEMVQTVAILVAVAAVVALVIIIAKRGVSIEIGG
ncbi:MAG: hypothetical protein LM580_08780 [Thermofilum sp.]|nr:hypothetical protein [Thermofilum sp.]